jgi:hypothetical protein
MVRAWPTNFTRDSEVRTLKPQLWGRALANAALAVAYKKRNCLDLEEVRNRQTKAQRQVKTGLQWQKN